MFWVKMLVEVSKHNFTVSIITKSTNVERRKPFTSNSHAGKPFLLSYGSESN